MASDGLPIASWIYNFNWCATTSTIMVKHSKLVTEDVKDGVQKIEAQLGKNFGASENPLLVSVRSGARVVPE